MNSFLCLFPPGTSLCEVVTWLTGNVFSQSLRGICSLATCGVRIFPHVLWSLNSLTSEAFHGAMPGYRAYRDFFPCLLQDSCTEILRQQNWL